MVAVVGSGDVDLRAYTLYFEFIILFFLVGSSQCRRSSYYMHMAHIHIHFNEKKTQYFTDMKITLTLFGKKKLSKNLKKR